MDTTFLLRDSGEIYGTYKTLEHAYNSLLQLVYTRYKYHKRDTITSCNIDNMVHAFQIIEYYNNVVKNVFNLDNDCYIYDSKKKMFPMEAISICDYITKINNFKSEEEFACNNLDIFLPVEDTEKTNTEKPIPTNTHSKEIKELEAQMLALESKKKTEVLKKKLMEEDLEEDLENEIQKKVIINSEIHDLIRDKKLYDEKRTKFIADYNAFLRIEKEMNCGKRTVDYVPEIFQRSYDVFKKMRKNNIIGKPQEEMFEYFLDNLDKVDFYSGEHNSLFDAPTFEDLKAFCPSDDEYYESSTENSSEEEYDETENMIQQVLNNKSLDELMDDHISHCSSVSHDTNELVRQIIDESHTASVNIADSDSIYNGNSDEDDSDLSDHSMSEGEKEKHKVMHSLMESMNKPFDI